MMQSVDEEAIADGGEIEVVSPTQSDSNNNENIIITHQPSTTTNDKKQSSQQHLKDPHMELFLTMHYRKMQRDLNGPQKKKTKYHLVILLCFLILVYASSASYAQPDESEGNKIVFALTLNQIILIGVWIFVAIVITGIFGSSKFILLLYWTLVYWPLLAVLASVLVTDILGSGEASVWVTWTLVIVEILTVLIYIVVNYIYPRLVTSSWFRGWGAQKFWRVKLLANGITMEYDGIWGIFSRRRYECRYVGEVNEKGLPHGRGVWSDDSYNGEVLTGMWEDGHPTAPFSSRQYGGKGNTFSAVKLVYYMANDDNFESNKFMPTNDMEPRFGMASVECSVAGDFMSHLPMVTLVGEEQVDREGDCSEVGVGNFCRQLDTATTTTASDKEVASTSLEINAGDPRGVQIGGHIFQPTGFSFTKRIKQIVVDVVRTSSDGGDDVEEAKYSQVDTAGDDEEKADGIVEGKKQISRVSSDSTASQNSNSIIRLQVRDWTKIGTKDALIFIPGFNSWLQHSLETFGQLMAMTQLSQRVYPVLFGWPGAQVLTYRYASLVSANENNRKYFLQMLRSLKAEGITNIHIVTHSMGVQTLMDCFEDKSNGSPSDVSQIFGPAPKSSGDTTTSSIADMGKLVCRSITMLNPDFPLYAFNEHGYQTLRRVTSLITVVGDVTDQALWWSAFINGIVNSVGWSQPSALDYEGRTDRTCLQAPLGRKIDSLYIKGDTDSSTEEDPISSRENDSTKVWLDCDVIDTTGLDTNVNNLRHSAYNVNSILLRDIEEIVITGKRAADRTSLLHKNGNAFEYCHAPSFVQM